MSLLLTVLFVPLAAGTPVTAAAPEETGKYYVVGPPVNGQRDYLYSIALRTLGNGNRFREIIELNRGREQPDGATFTDGVELAPGWILVLPKDADGPGVRTGRLPAIRPPTPRSTPSPVTPSPSSASPTPRVPSPSPSAVGSPSATAASAAEPTAPAASGPRAEAGPSILADVTPGMVRIGAGALALALAVVAILVLPRRAYRMRSVTLDDGPWPPERHHTPTPAELAARTGATPSAPRPGPRPVPAAAPRVSVTVAADTEPAPAPAPGPAATAEPPLPAAPGAGTPEPSDARTPAAPDPGAAARPASGPGPMPSASPPEWPPIAGPATATPAGPSVAAQQPGTPDETGPPRPALPVDGEVPYVRTELSTDLGPILVRLVGVTTGPTTAAYAWLADHEPTPTAAVPLVLGRRGPWRLQIDLGRAPDVFTLVGAVDECRRLAAAYARQLHEAGVVVAVVGDALGVESLDGCRRLTSWPAPDDFGSEPYIVIITGLPADAGAGMRGLAAGSGGRCVPLVIGPVPYGRWSAQLGGGD
ncbi:hypothetical protein AB0M35_18570 [Micromonospora sp. NPDC051196]|uniref:hypothetical protein n=1 Tax=Micromonospora sp. NPDC051196 TaxID=3155281 RepID=UPI003433212E